MSVRRTTCPKCGCGSIETLEILNPKTRSLNADARLRCEVCCYEWQGRVISPYMREQRRLGRVRI